MQQIADQLGVSKFAVSQALSGKPGVSDETRNRIIQAAAAQGYYSQRHTRGKARPVSLQEMEKKPPALKNTVIVLIPNVRYQLPESAFWGKIADGVIAGLADRGIGSMVVTEHNSDRFLHIINPASVLGLVGIGLVADQIVLEIRNAGIPFVLIDHEDSLILSDTIFMNNYDSVHRLTEYLIYLGHKSLKFVGNPGYSRSFFDRWLGFRTALEEMRLPVQEAGDRLLQIEDDREVEDILKSMYARKSMPTAFVCANDATALHVLRTLAELGIRVPEDVSVTGFDNTEEAARLSPPLSTVDVPKTGMGRRAVELLLRRIENPDKPFEKMLIHGEFINRQSIAPV